MSTEELIRRLIGLAEWSSEYWQNLPGDMAPVLYRAAATIEVLREELKYLLDKENRDS